MQTLYITVDMLCISAVLALFHTSSPLSLSPLYSNVKKDKNSTDVCVICFYQGGLL